MVKLGAGYPNYKGILNLGDFGVCGDAVEIVEDRFWGVTAKDIYSGAKAMTCSSASFSV
jgi:hypothetical protein